MCCSLESVWFICTESQYSDHTVLAPSSDRAMLVMLVCRLYFVKSLREEEKLESNITFKADGARM